MTNPNFADDQEPLDPALEKIRRKMVRLLVISSSVIVLGLMAVLGSIVYKANKNSAATSAQQTMLAPSAVAAAQQTVALPKGFTLESTTVDGNRIWFMGTVDGKHLMIVHDIGTGKTLTEISVVPQ
jgi:hypothetical protein